MCDSLFLPGWACTLESMQLTNGAVVTLLVLTVLVLRLSTVGG